jgi:O-antigen ligase
VYLSYSRGAIAIAVLGLALLVAAARTRTQLRASATALATGAAAAAAAAVFPGVAALEGSEPVSDGAAVLALLCAIAAGAAALTARRIARERVGPADALPWARRLTPVAAALAAAVAAGLVVAGLSEKPTAAELAAGAQATRLTTVSSNRYEYWRVGLLAVAEHPVKGLAAGGFRVFWLQERSIPESVRDVHSLELEIAAELGVVGLIAFGLMLGGVIAAARSALRRDAGLAAGATAAALAWLLHASIDWDWQLPAVTLPAVVLAATLIALAEAPAGAISRPARSPDPAGAARSGHAPRPQDRARA